MTEVILYEVHRLACVEKMRRYRMAQQVDVPKKSIPRNGAVLNFKTAESAN